MRRLRVTPHERTCPDCGSGFRPNHNTQIRCHGCGTRGPFARAKSKAHQAVWRAVRAGQLACLGASFVPCADCGKRASAYDHRDYLKPLDVSPVCRPCNWKRGTAPFALRPDVFGPAPKAEAA